MFNKNQKKQYLLAALLAILITFGPAGTAHAVMVELSLEELSTEADSVILGTVEEISSQWNEDYTSIYSTVTVIVEELISGVTTGSTVSIIVPGGNVDGITQFVSDNPNFKPGEKAVFFLNERPGQILPRRQIQPKTYAVFGSFQGKFEVKGNKSRGIQVEILKEEIKTIAVKGHSQLNLDLTEVETDYVNGYDYTYSGVRWPGSSPVVPYKINASTSDRNQHIQAAAGTWNNAGANFTFRYDGTHSRIGLASKNNVNEILWGDLNTGALATATIWYDQNKRILETDIVFNTRYSWYTNGYAYYDVQTVALHELGHWLCLEHSSVEGSIMYYRMTGVQRYLHEVDIAGIHHIYGTSGTVIENNDNFADRYLINGLSGQTTGTNINSTSEPGEPIHARSGGGRSVWWEWVAPQSGFAEITTFGSNYDTVLAVYTGNTVSSLTEIASNDDYGGTRQSRVGFNANSGNSYKIAVDGWLGATGNIVLNWQLSPIDCAISVPPPPSGPDSGFTETTYIYSIETGASCSNSHPVEYRFDWGDDRYSGWSSSLSSEIIWSVPGTYQVRSQARCATETTKLSSWSAGKEVTITVEPVEYSLLVSIEGEGMTDPLPGTYRYEENTLVNLSATADQNWTFDKWIIDDEETSESALLINMDSDITATAVFIENPDSVGQNPDDPNPEGPEEYVLTIQMIGQGITEPAAGTYTVEEGSEINLNAIEVDNWHFQKWVINDVEDTALSVTIDIDEDTDVTAIFNEVMLDEPLPSPTPTPVPSPDSNHHLSQQRILLYRIHRHPIHPSCLHLHLPIYFH
jgi:hypothetical protein